MPGTLSDVINLVIVDGSRTFGDVVAARLAAEPDMRVLHSATSSAALSQAVSHSSVDVVVCGAALFDSEGRSHGQGGGHPSAQRATGNTAAGDDHGLRKPAVVLLADYGDRSLLCPAIRSGVRGWVPRDASVNDLIAAVRGASEGGTWIPPRLLTELLDELTGASPVQDPAQKLLAGLTSRERDVLTCLADGLGRAEVAARLHVSTNTVRTHVQSILSKLQVSSSVAAVAVARKVNLTSGSATRPYLT
jgi:DNA-binding NarL/FixJ family response regulator